VTRQLGRPERSPGRRTAKLPVIRSEDRGATATKNALLVGFIAIVIAIAIGFFGDELSSYFNSIGNGLGSWL